MIKFGRSGNIFIEDRRLDSTGWRVALYGGQSRALLEEPTLRLTDTISWRQGLRRVAAAATGDTRHRTIFRMENYLVKIKIRQ